MAIKISDYATSQYPAEYMETRRLTDFDSSLRIRADTALRGRQGLLCRSKIKDID